MRSNLFFSLWFRLFVIRRCTRHSPTNYFHSNVFKFIRYSPKAEIQNSHETRMHEHTAHNECPRALKWINSLSQSAFSGAKQKLSPCVVLLFHFSSSKWIKKIHSLPRHSASSVIILKYFVAALRNCFYLREKPSQVWRNVASKVAKAVWQSSDTKMAAHASIHWIPNCEKW